MERVIGLGGPFIKAKDPKALCDWYQKHLGIPFNGNTNVIWNFDLEVSKNSGFNIFSVFPYDSAYFKPSEKPTMINFIVKDLLGLIETLKQEGVEIAGDPVSEEYGRFGWVIDPEGNKIELWEPPAG